MALTDEQQERLTMILEAIEPETKRMNERSAAFVQDQVKRFGEYGARTFMSPKQWSWLESLYEEFGGDAKETAPLDEGDDEDHHTDSANTDLDDEIPF